MKKQLFDDLLASVAEMKSIERGETKPSRVFELEVPDVKEIRKRQGVTQAAFAAMMGINLETLRNWEQGRRQPEGPARVLLHVVSRHPAIVSGTMRAAGLQEVPSRRRGRPSKG